MTTWTIGRSVSNFGYWIQFLCNNVFWGVLDRTNEFILIIRANNCRFWDRLYIGEPRAFYVLCNLCTFIVCIKTDERFKE